MILIIDNYDSFTHNLVHFLAEGCSETTEVARNDSLTVAEIESKAHLEAIIISPGPCTPDEAGISLDLVPTLGNRMPILGVCLGHQSIAQAFGGRVVRANLPMHGKTSLVTHNGKGVFKGIESPLEATRYHSLVVDEDSLPNCFEITARSPQNEIMGIRHREFTSLIGVQFHPESLFTHDGKQILKNFVYLAASTKRRS